jgi:hypothetical protein
MIRVRLAKPGGQGAKGALVLGAALAVLLGGARPCPAPPTKPAVAAQADELAAYLSGLLTEHWKAWRADEIAAYAGAFGDVLKQGLQEPLPADRVEAVKQSLAAYCKLLTKSDPGSGWATRESLVAEDIEAVRWKTRTFVERAPMTAEEAATLHGQIADIAEAARVQAEKVDADVEPEVIARLARELGDKLNTTADDVLSLYLKRPLTAEELRGVTDVIESLPKLYEEERTQAQRRLDALSRVLSAERLKAERDQLGTRALRMAMERVRQAVLRVGEPPPWPPLTAAIRQVDTEQIYLPVIQQFEMALRLFELGVGLVSGLDGEELSPYGWSAPAGKAAREVTCEATVSFSKLWPPQERKTYDVGLRLLAKAPDELKIVFTNDNALHLGVMYTHARDAYIVNGREWAFDAPHYGMTQRFTLGGAGDPRTMKPDRSSPWDIRDLGLYVGAMFDLARADYYDQAKPTPAGAAANEGLAVTEFVAQAPRKPIEPHTVARVRCYRQADGGRLVKLEALAPDGSVVSTTTYTWLAAEGGRPPVPASSETIVAPGLATPNPEQEWGTKGGVPWPGRRIVRHYRWLAAEGLAVPSEVRVYDDSGEELMAASLTGYRVNGGVQDSEFAIPDR